MTETAMMKEPPNIMYVSVCGMFNDAASSSICIALGDEWLTNNKLETTWKETALS